MEEIHVNQKEKRIDTFLMKELSYSRSFIQHMIEEGFILVNGKKIKNSASLKEGDTIFITPYEKEIDIKPENIPLSIVYEDEDVLVVNKENGMVVHPAPGHYSHTLVNALMYHSKSLSSINGDFRPGIVHRIDADTTGLLLVAKNNKAHEILAKELEEKKTYRVYLALVHGVILHDTGTVDAPIGRDVKDRKRMCVTSFNSKHAITHFKVLERYKNASLLELHLETGRTHQIRVHMQYIGHPVVNDPIYGKKKLIDDTGQCLHAKKIGFIHPTTSQYMEFSCALPSCFTKIQNIYKEEK